MPEERHGPLAGKAERHVNRRRGLPLISSITEAVMETRVSATGIGATASPWRSESGWWAASGRSWRTSAGEGFPTLLEVRAAGRYLLKAGCWEVDPRVLEEAVAGDREGTGGGLDLGGEWGSGWSEQTFEYTPPEALLNSSWFHAPCRIRLKYTPAEALLYYSIVYFSNYSIVLYDMWSVGVVMLELILGSPHVFQITDRNRALVDQHLEGWSEPIKDLIYK
ncbi:putative inactive protein kinase [Platanthera guangdongensis]|uniref:Inactive protein kinase n=1 Tax=Platanthera guangdongensis TaxID=2320717 RepID=A0ABR2MF97_9ASPA